MQVVLETEPDDTQGKRIEGQECRRLKGYGTIFMQRLFNKYTLLDDDNPIFADTANFAVAFAILLSRVMRGVPFANHDIRERNKEIDVPNQCYLSTERWWMFNSSHLLFWGINLDKRLINEYLDNLSGKSIEDMAMPTSIRNYLEQLKENRVEIMKVLRQNWLDDIK